MRTRIEVIVFWVGVALFGFFYAQFEAMFSSGPWFLVSAIAYLLALRLVGRQLQRTLGRTRGNS